MMTDHDWMEYFAEQTQRLIDLRTWAKREGVALGIAAPRWVVEWSPEGETQRPQLFYTMEEAISFWRSREVGEFAVLHDLQQGTQAGG